MKNYSSFISIVVLLLLCTACSSTGQAYLNTLRYAFKANNNEISLEQISTSKSDLMRVNVNDSKSAILALAYIDDDKYRWVSGDHIVFTMHHGIITQTEGLPKDLHYTGNLENNPLSGNRMLTYSWNRSVDISSIGYDLPVQSRWRIEGEVTRTYFDRSISLLKVVETVVFPDVTPFIEPKRQWENTYYLDSQSKDLLASTQKFNPIGDVYEMIYISRIARMIEATEPSK